MMCAGYAIIEYYEVKKAKRDKQMQSDNSKYYPTLS